MFQPVDLKTHVPKAWEFYRSLNSPKYICAPMVDHSHCGFRMLCRKYNTQLCYTPMLNSKMMVMENSKYTK